MKFVAQPASSSQGRDLFRLRLKPLAAIVLSMMACAAIPQAVADAVLTPQTQTGAVDEVSFDNMYLRGDAGSAVDTSRFTRGNAVSPGTYSVDLIVNGTRLAREDIRFVSIDGKLRFEAVFQPCAAATRGCGSGEGRCSGRAHHDHDYNHGQC